MADPTTLQNIIADPRFNQLSATDQQGVLGKVDPRFIGISVDEVPHVIGAIKSQAPPSPTQLGNQALAASGIPGGAAPPVSNVSPQQVSYQAPQSVRAPMQMQTSLLGYVPGAASAVGNTAIGAAKGALDTAATMGATAGGPQYLQGGGINQPQLNYKPPKVIQPQGTAQKVGFYGEKVAEVAAPLGYGAVKAARALPDAEKAALIFEDLKGSIGQHTVDISAPGNTAIQMQDFANRGGTLPKVARNFIQRVTDPNQGPLTYSEARDFYQNATRLSFDELNRLTPYAKKMVGQFTQDLNGAIEQTADQAGRLQDYRNAMSTYRGASTMASVKEFARQAAVEAAKSAVKSAIPFAGAEYLINKYKSK